MTHDEITALLVEGGKGVSLKPAAASVAATVIMAAGLRLVPAGASTAKQYEERSRVVAALARLFPSGTRKTDIPGWKPDWHGCVYIDLPTGQISYHYHDDHAHLFAGLPAYEKPYDGHMKADVWARLAGLGKMRLHPAERPMTADERREQAVSFVFGQLMDAQPNVTKDEIRKRLFGGGDE